MSTREELEKRIEVLDELLVQKKQQIEKELFQLESILQELVSLRNKLAEMIHG